MIIIQDLLQINAYSRPARRMREVLAIVMHWTADPKSTPKDIRNFFDYRKNGTSGYGSAHYIIGRDGRILQCIPETEISYHCGTDIPDPESGKIYTDEARKRFGKYATEESSPNLCTIGVEMVPRDDAGNFTGDTIKSAVELCTDICRRYGLKPDAITTHNAVVGWKDCPRLWVKYPVFLEAFRFSVADKLLRG